MVLQVGWIEIPSLGISLDHRERYKVKSVVMVLKIASELIGEEFCVKCGWVGIGISLEGPLDAPLL